MCNYPDTEFFVPGLPRPAGSKKAFHHRTTGQLIVTDDSGASGKRWRVAVKQAAQRAFCIGALARHPLQGALRLQLIFYVPRPKGHFGSGKGAAVLRPLAPHYPTVRPDATKLLRAVEDALTGVLWTDDAQIVEQRVTKLYANADQAPGVRVLVWEK